MDESGGGAEGDRTQSRRAEIVKAWLNGHGLSDAARTVGVSRQRVDQAVRAVYTIDGLSAACAARGVDADAVADVLAGGLSADRALVIPDGKGGATVSYIEDHVTRLKAAQLLINVELKLKELAQTVEVQEAEVRLDGVDIGAMDRDQLTALVMRRTVRRAT